MPSNGYPPSGVYVCDGTTSACNVLGIPGNEMSVRVAGTTDGGSPNAVDTTPGDLQTTTVKFPGGFTAALVKGDGGVYVGAVGANVGQTTGYLLCWDAAALDAGALIDSGSTPTFPAIVVPALSDYSFGGFPATVANGLACYVSSTPLVLTIDAGVPTFVGTFGVR